MAIGKTSRTLKGLSLLTILVLFVAFNPSMMAWQVQITSSVDAHAAILSEKITERYLMTFGYKSPEKVQYAETFTSGILSISSSYNVLDSGTKTMINVDSAFQIQNTTAIGYVYSANFTSSKGKEYFVIESIRKISNKNQVITIANEKITGSMNYYVYATEKKTIGNVVTKQSDIKIQFSNASGSYYLLTHTTGIWSLNESTILNATTTLDQNIIGQSGHYVLSFAPTSNGLGAKVNMTKPDGTIIDPGVWQFVDEWDCVGNHLLGWYFWWYKSEGNWMNLGLWVIGVILTVIPPTTVIGLALDAIGGLVMIGAFFESSMAGITMLYIESIELLGVFLIYWEAGFYTDQFNGSPLGNWWYISLLCSIPGLLIPHTDPWPPYYL